MTGYESITAREAIVQSAAALSDVLTSHITIYLTLLLAYIVVAYRCRSQFVSITTATFKSTFRVCLVLGDRSNS